jgi:hypothetical protein
MRTATPTRSAALAFAAFLAAGGSGMAGELRLVEAANPRDGMAPGQSAAIRTAIAAYEKARGPRPAGKDVAPFLYPFFPHAGVLGQDLFLNNFTDQDPRSGLVRDWDCSDYTYDGHQGHDSLLRSFREQDLGVPVFAARDGVVVDAHDGEPDRRTAWDPRNLANYVVIDHGSGYYGLYLHFRRGSVAVSRGQAVAAGAQIGLTGSSGLSDWPHLHFETRTSDVNWIEPSAGPCRPGGSLWSAQPPVERDFYVAGFYLTAGAIALPDDDSFLFDEAVRTASFVKGARTVGVRVDLRNLAARLPYQVRVLSPARKLAYQSEGVFGNQEVFHLAYATFAADLDLSAVGTWRLQLLIDGAMAVDAPFRVVATARQAANRPPNRIAARLSALPAEGAANGRSVLSCQVQTSLAFRDPDYDLVSYVYAWQVNGHLVRTAASAALTDLLAADKAAPGDRVTCRVVPTDGKRAGPAAVATRVVAP